MAFPLATASPPPVLEHSEPSPGDHETLLLLAVAQAGPRLLGAGRRWDQRTDGALTRALERLDFGASPGEIALVTLPGGRPSLAVVAGIPPEPTSVELRRAFGAAARAAPRGTAVAPDLAEAAAGRRHAALLGLLAGALARDALDRGGARLERIAVPTASAAECVHATAVAAAAQTARVLTNAPPGALGPDELAQAVEALADGTPATVEVARGDALRALGCGALEAVGGGSARAPLLLTLRYAHPAARARLGLVAKGVTFDSGGLCLKPAGDMLAMKHDLAGAASAIAATLAAARAGWPLDVELLVPVAENMTGGGAYRPGDVVSHPDGTTTEIVNTDAEGRLILADALALIAREPRDAILDVATLEDGWLAVGPRTIPVFASDDGLAAELARAAATAGEACWRLPLFPEYGDELSSKLADRRHCGRTAKRPTPMLAALYLQRFVPPGVPWAHLDVAEAVATPFAHGDTEEGATGIPTATLIEWLRERAFGDEDPEPC